MTNKEKYAQLKRGARSEALPMDFLWMVPSHVDGFEFDNRYNTKQTWGYEVNAEFNPATRTIEDLTKWREQFTFPDFDELVAQEKYADKFAVLKGDASCVDADEHFITHTMDGLYTHLWGLVGATELLEAVDSAELAELVDELVDFYTKRIVYLSAELPCDAIIISDDILERNGTGAKTELWRRVLCGAYEEIVEWAKYHGFEVFYYDYGYFDAAFVNDLARIGFDGIMGVHQEHTEAESLQELMDVVDGRMLVFGGSDFAYNIKNPHREAANSYSAEYCGEQIKAVRQVFLDYVNFVPWHNLAICPYSGYQVGSPVGNMNAEYLTWEGTSDDN